MLNLNYRNYRFGEVKDLANFWGSTNIPEMSKIRAVHTQCKALLNLPDAKIPIFVAQGQRYYRFDFYANGARKTIIGQLYILPKEERIDLYLPENPGMPTIQWRKKKVVHKGYSPVLDLAGFDKLFNSVVNVS